MFNKERFVGQEAIVVGISAGHSGIMIQCHMLTGHYHDYRKNKWVFDSRNLRVLSMPCPMEVIDAEVV